jgi:hypothetical protein
MGSGLKISYVDNSFKIVLPNGKTVSRTQPEMLKYGGIVGNNTSLLIKECKATPGKVITTRFVGA